MTYPPSGQPWQPGQPDPNQPPYGGGYSGAPDQPHGDQQYGQAPYQQESYNIEPPMSGQPYSQPYSGAPYDPGHGAPQPGYHQGHGPHQGYQQPGYQQYAPVQQPPSFVTPAAPRGNTGGIIALVAGGVVLVLVLIGVIGALVFVASDGDDEPVVATSEGPTASSTGTTGATDAEYPARIDLPQTVAGLTKIDDPELNKTANDTALLIKNGSNADTAYAAYYSPAGDLARAVGLFGATGRISNPQGELDDAFGSELAVSSVQSVDPGPLGGYMKCGNTVSGGQTLTVCGWADGGSLMLGIFANRSLTDSSVLYRQIRGEILKRG